jgi:uncharacterized cupredoxin-like copper-binding protein
MAVQGNSVVFAIVEQTSTSSGVPANPVFDVFPHTGGNIDDTIGTTVSNMVDSTRQSGRPVLTSSEVAADIASEMQVKEAAFQKVVKGVLQNSIGSDVNVNGTTISFDAANSKILDSGNGFTNVAVGDYLGVFGASTAANNQVYLVTAKADNGDITVSPSPATESAGAAVKIRAKKVRSDKNEVGYTLQKRTPGSDGTVFETYEGMQVSSLSVSVTPQSLITTTTNFIGMNIKDGVTQIAGATTNAEPNDRVVGTVSGIPQLFMDNVGVSMSSLMATDTSFSIDNGSTGTPVNGKSGAGMIRHEAISVTGSLTTYLGDTISAIQQEKIKARNQTEFQLAFVFKDPDNNYVVFDFPTVQYSSMTREGTENGTLQTNNGQFTAHGKNTAGYTVGCTFIEAP